MNGWRYEWLDALPIDVYETLVRLYLRDAAPADALDDALQLTE